MACCLKEEEARRLTEKKSKSDKDAETNLLDLIPFLKKLVSGR